MSLFKVFDVAATALNAQSLRLNLVSSNLANAESVSSSTGEVYRARHPVFAAELERAGFGQDDAVGGVRVLGVIESDAPLRKKHWPGHPQADENGYVYLPNVNVVEELANMISASRSFQTNVEVMNASKQMLTRTLSLGQQ